MSKYNKPMDRDYFKKKKNPDWDAKKKLTECCQQDIDHEVLNVFKKDDWEQIEEHIRQQLHDIQIQKQLHQFHVRNVVD